MNETLYIWRNINTNNFVCMKQLLCSLALSLSAVVAMAQEKYLLRLTPTEGDTKTYTVSTSVTNDITSGGQTIQMLMDVSIEMSHTYKDIAGDRLKQQTAFGKVKASASVMGQKQDLSSLIAKELEGKVFTLTLDKQGKPVEGTGEGGLQELLKGKSLPDLSSYTVLPEAAVAVGDTWQSSITVESLPVQMTYTLAEVRDDVYVIKGTGVMSGTVQGVTVDGTLELTSALDRKTCVEVPGATNSTVHMSTTGGTDGTSMKSVIKSNL